MRKIVNKESGPGNASIGVRDIACLLLMIFATVLLVYRAFRSVELTDEAYGIAEIYNASFGKRPFIDIWDPHTGWFLYTPFLWLFKLCSPNLSGIILYFRLVYFMLAGITLTITFVLLSRNWPKKDRCSLGLAVFSAACYVCFSIPCMGHNAGVSFALILASSLLYTSDNARSHFVAGIVIGISCLLYPTLAVLALLLAALIPLACQPFRRRRCALAYCAGVMIVGALFFAWIATPPRKNLLIGIKATVSTPHETNKGAIDLQFLKLTFVDRVSSFMTVWQKVVFLLYPALAIFHRLIDRSRGKGWLHIQTGLYLLFILLSCAGIFLDKGIQPISRGGYTSFSLLYASIVFIIFNGDFIDHRVLILYFLLVGWILTYCFTSDNRNLFAGMDASGSMTMFVSSLTIASSGARSTDRHAVIPRYLALAVSIAIGLSCYYGYVYRDAPVSALNKRVETGIYKGLWTTRQNKELVEALEAEVKREIDADKTICVVNNMPAIYLMSQAKICAPQTWDAQFLARGYTSASPLLTYFEYRNEWPDRMIACDCLYTDLFQRDDIEIWSFIDENYKSEFQSDEPYGTIAIWSREHLPFM